MEVVTLEQGIPEWHAHRKAHRNASDTPAVLGASPYKSRTDFLRECATGITPEVDAGTQRRFDNGHRFEALARPLAEQIIEEELAPLVGKSGLYSASFDGLTLMGDVAWEHKTLGKRLQDAMFDGCTGDDLPPDYRAQMEHQLMVSGANRVLFMASNWTSDDTLIEERHCWYTSDANLRASILAAWEQFAIDLATYTPPSAAVIEKLVAEPVEALPAPVVQVTGQLALTDNFKAFEQRLRDFLDTKLIREPKTDEDFVNLDAQIKAMKAGREALKSAKAQMLAQVQPVDQANKTADMLDKLLQQNCSMAEQLLKDEKDRRRTEIITGGMTALQQHVAALNTRLGKAYMPAALATADFAGAIKGMRSLASMEDAVETMLARAKIAANEVADRIQLNLTTLREQAGTHPFLFADAPQLVMKANDDLQVLIKSRIADHQAAELAKEEATRQRIRAEEQAKAQQEAAEAAAKEAQRVKDAEYLAGAEQREQARQAEIAGAALLARQREAASSPTPAVNVVPMRAAPAPAATSTAPSLKLGQIAERLGFTLTADFLKTLGFEPAATDRASKLYHEASFPHMCAALVQHIEAIQRQRAA